MNPITSKLEKIFGKKKRSSCTFQSTLSESFNTSEPNITLSEDYSQISDDHFKSQHRELERNKKKKRDFGNLDTNKENVNFIQNGKCQKSYLIQEELEMYKKIAKSLQEKVQDHQLLEEFYLEKLRERDENEKELKWKLEIIGEEIRKNRLTSRSVEDWNEVNDGQRSERAISADY